MKLELVKDTQVQPKGLDSVQTMNSYLVKLDGKILFGSPDENAARTLYGLIRGKIDEVKTEVLLSEEF